MTRKRRSAEAVQKLFDAQGLWETSKELEAIGQSAKFENRRAEALEAEAKELLKPAGEIIRGCGEAMDLDPSATAVEQNWNLVETLKDPDTISLCASRDRMDLLRGSDVLAPGLDAAKSVQATNSLEKMLVHQMAAVHRAAMKFLARGLEEGTPCEAARLANTAARLMDVYRTAMLALQKVRTGGKHTVVVQHVRGADGGQAVIVSKIRAGSHREAEGRETSEKNGNIIP
jgi:hypothetical protein